MGIDEELKEIEAIHAAFDDLVSHGKPIGVDGVAVSVEGLVKLQQRIDQLHHDLRAAWSETQASRSRSELREILARLGRRRNQSS